MRHQTEVRNGEENPYICIICFITWKYEPSGYNNCMGKPCYYWQQTPDTLRTFTQLKEDHLKPLDRAKPDAYLWLKDGWTPLYDRAKSLPRRQMTEAQKATRAAAWMKTQEKYTCEYCGAVPENLAAIKRFTPGACISCFELCQHWAMLDEDHQHAIHQARKLLAREDVAIVDTETTDLNGVVLELAIIDLAGQTLFHSLINPESHVSPGARSVHQITDKELAAAPTLPQIWPAVVEALAGRTLLLAYNADFDSGILEYSARRYGLEPLVQKWRCLMRLYAKFVGEWSEYWESYRWQPLNGGHRALGDVLAALDILRAMAEQPEDEPSPTAKIQEETEVRMIRWVKEQSQAAVAKKEQGEGAAS